MGKILLIISILLFFLSCDVSKEDYLSPSYTDENQTNIFYTLPASGLSINPAAFKSLKDVSSLSISRLPKNGEAKFIDNGFVFYHLSALNATTDDFKIQGKTLAGTLVEEEIKINFVQNQSELPCHTGLIGESISTNTEQATEIDVLANDKSCGGIGAITIEIAPKNGKAEIINRKIIYTPNKGFAGTDLFFYRAALNNTKNPVAPVEVSVNDASLCQKGLIDDNVIIQNYSSGTEIQIDVLENDKICKDYETAELKIEKNPTKGNIRIAKNSLNRMVCYYKTAQKSIEDTFEYALYRTEKDFIKATVTIKIE